MRVITTEEHFRDPDIAAATRSTDWSETLRSLGPQALRHGSGVLDRLDDLGAGRLDDMDASGIDVQVLSHTFPSVELLEPALARSLARRANDRLAAAVADHPERFCGLATLPTPDPRGAADELQRAVLELGFRGALINGRTNDRFLDGPEFWPIFERAQDLEVPIYLHPGLPPSAVREAYYGGLSPVVNHWLSIAAWGWHVETGLHVLRLIAAGTFDRYPKLQLVIGHMGEALPFMLERTNLTLSQEMTRLQRPVVEYFRENLHVTTSGFFSRPPLDCLLSQTGADRVLFAVDYPYSSNQEGSAFLAGLELESGLREKVAHGNAERLFKLSQAVKEPPASA